MQQSTPITENAAAATKTQVAARMNGTVGGSGLAVPRKPNVLHLSIQRNRRFYERTARELFASGCEDIELSALKTAAPLAIAVALTLQDKKAATISKVNTQQVTFENTQNRPNTSSGITIILNRHPEFKGTRIVPSHIFFTPPLTNSNVWAYPETFEGIFGLFASVISGPADNLFNSKYGEALMSVLKKTELGDLEMQKKLQAHLFKEAVAANKDTHDLKSIKFMGEVSAVKSYNPHLKAAFARVCPDVDQTTMTGTVFVEVFEDQACPHNNATNGVLLYLIAPRESAYKSTKEFLDAVQLAASNLMATLCDFNGYCRRESSHSTKLKRIAVVRIGLFSHEPNQPATTKAQIAKAILKGLNEAYHFGIAPKLQFVNLEGEDVIKNAWIEASGSEASLRITENNFGRRSSTEQ